MWFRLMAARPFACTTRLVLLRFRHLMARVFSSNAEVRRGVAADITARTIATCGCINPRRRASSNSPSTTATMACRVSLARMSSCTSLIAATVRSICTAPRLALQLILALVSPTSMAWTFTALQSRSMARVRWSRCSATCGASISPKKARLPRSSHLLRPTMAWSTANSAPSGAMSMKSHSRLMARRWPSWPTAMSSYAQPKRRVLRDA